MMKKCIFRKNIFGFGEWCNYVRTIMNYASNYNSCTGNQKLQYYNDHKTLLDEYKIILEYKRRLNAKQILVFDNYLTRHHIVPNELHFSQFDYQEMYNLWVEVRFSNKNILVIKDYSSEELGTLIFNAREYDERTRIEVANIIGISPNTLKMYEEGKRMIPSNVFLMLNQLYGDIFDLNNGFPVNPLFKK